MGLTEKSGLFYIIERGNDRRSPGRGNTAYPVSLYRQTRKKMSIHQPRAFPGFDIGARQRND